MGTDYQFLITSRVIFKILAVALLSLGVISAAVIFASGGSAGTPAWAGLVVLLIGTIYSFFLLVVSEVIRLLLEISDK